MCLVACSLFGIIAQIGEVVKRRIILKVTFLFCMTVFGFYSQMPGLYLH